MNRGAAWEMETVRGLVAGTGNSPLACRNQLEFLERGGSTSEKVFISRGESVSCVNGDRSPMGTADKAVVVTCGHASRFAEQYWLFTFPLPSPAEADE